MYAKFHHTTQKGLKNHKIKEKEETNYKCTI